MQDLLCERNLVLFLILLIVTIEMELFFIINQDFQIDP